VLRTTLPEPPVLDDWMRARARRVMPPDPALIDRAAAALWAAKRPVVITGGGARGAGAAITRLLDATGALYLDTQESRGLVDPDHASVVGARCAGG